MKIVSFCQRVSFTTCMKYRASCVKECSRVRGISKNTLKDSIVFTTSRDSDNTAPTVTRRWFTFTAYFTIYINVDAYGEQGENNSRRLENPHNTKRLF